MGFDEKKPLAGEAKLLRQLTRGDYEVDSPSVAEGSDQVFFNSTEGSPLEVNLWTMRLDGSGKRKVTTGRGVHNPLVSPSGEFYADLYGNSTTPYLAQVCGTAANDCKVVWKPKELGTVTGVKSEFVTLKAADRVTTTYGMLTQPANAAGKASVPIILNPYGGPIPFAEARDQWTGQGGMFSQLLAQHGFAVLSLDGRGSGGRGRDFQQADYKNFGAVQFSDQMAALGPVAGDKSAV